MKNVKIGFYLLLIGTCLAPTSTRLMLVGWLGGIAWLGLSALANLLSGPDERRCLRLRSLRLRSGNGSRPGP